jgi:hypothetical protein
MAETFNGFGSMYYGHSDPLPDGTYTATKWFVIFWVPIFPKGSYRLLKMDAEFIAFPPGFKTTYASHRLPLNIKQVIKTYAVTAALVALLVYLLLKG